MPKPEGGTHVCEIPLQRSAHKEKILGVRFGCGYQAFNAALDEALRRIKLMRQSKDWQKARKLPKGNSDGSKEQKAQAKARGEAFNTACLKFGFTEFSLLEIWTSKPMSPESRLQGALKRKQRRLRELLARQSEIEALPETDKDRTKLLKENEQARSKAVSDLTLLAITPLESKPVGKLGGSWLVKHLGVHVCQAATSKAWVAIQEYSFGKKGKPKFRSKYDPPMSVDGKSGASLRWNKGRVEWGGLILEPLIKRDQHGRPVDPVIAYSLHKKIKYVRIVRKASLRGYDYAVQLVCDGPSYNYQREVGTATVGLDLGPSGIAIVAHEGSTVVKAELCKLAPEIIRNSEKIRRLQRKLDRQLRANNLDCYRPNGTFIKGSKAHNRSNRQLGTKLQLSLIQTKQAAHRKSLHGRRVNELVSLGVNATTEKLNYKVWQGHWGRSIRDRAPGLLIEMYRKKCERYGGKLGECSTKTTKMSRTCHCRTVKFKTLSQRWHSCTCGVGPVQRDIYSAFLASCVKQDVVRGDQLDVESLKKLWDNGADKLLKAASSEAVKAGLVRPYRKCEKLTPHGVDSPSNGSEHSSEDPDSKLEGISPEHVAEDEIQDVVPTACGKGEPGGVFEPNRNATDLSTHRERRGGETRQPQSSQQLRLFEGDSKQSLSQSTTQVQEIVEL